MYDHISLEVREGVATVTLNRPDKLNAYIPAMGDEVVDAFGRIRDDADARVVVLTGAGRGFCAGVDLDALKEHQASVAASGGKALGEEAFVKRFPLELAAFPKPVIAAINGAAIGVGVTMVLPCDLRIAAESAKLGVTFVKLGILPGLGSTHWLPRLVGMANAKDLVLTGRVVRAPEALSMGLVNRVVPDGELMKEVREVADALAALDPPVLAAAKRVLHAGAEATMEEAMQNEARESAALRKLRGR